MTLEMVRCCCLSVVVFCIVFCVLRDLTFVILLYNFQTEKNSSDEFNEIDWDIDDELEIVMV